MKTLLSTSLALLTLAAGYAQEAEPVKEKPTEKEEQIKIPSTLAEAHKELERLLPKEELAKIDAMKTEDEPFKLTVVVFGVQFECDCRSAQRGDAPECSFCRQIIRRQGI